MPEADRPRLVLVTPPDADPATFAPRLAAALGGGDVASVIVAGPSDPEAQQRLAAALVPITAKAGVAILLHGDSRVAGRAGVDGLHVEGSLADLRDAIGRFQPKRMVGAGGVRTRHDAMSAGEAGPDYIFFGRLDGDSMPDVHPKPLELAEWWAGLFEIPAVLMAGSTLASVAEAAAAGVEFVALRRAVWDHPDGPAAAVAEANRLLAAGVPA